jgi:hypothetical protein
MVVPTTHEANEFKHVLSYFMAVMGTTINYDKSQIFFFDTPPTVQINISHILGFQWSSLQYKYVGAPLVYNVLRNVSWGDLLNNLEQKLASWNFQSLNLEGHLALLKLVLQTMPLYSFSALATPKSLLKAICNLQ